MGALRRVESSRQSADGHWRLVVGRKCLVGEAAHVGLAGALALAWVEIAPRSANLAQPPRGAPECAAALDALRVLDGISPETLSVARECLLPIVKILSKLCR